MGRDATGSSARGLGSARRGLAGGVRRAGPGSRPTAAEPTRPAATAISEAWNGSSRLVGAPDRAGRTIRYAEATTAGPAKPEKIVPSRPAPRQRAAAAAIAPTTAEIAIMRLGADHHVSGMTDGASRTARRGARNDLWVVYPTTAPKIPTAQIQTTVIRTLRPMVGMKPARIARTVPTTIA